MQVTCPRCGTVFSLPDAAYKPGRKVRCSQCQFVFTLPSPEEVSSAPKKKSFSFLRKFLPSFQVKKRFLFYLGLCICLMGVGLGAYHFYEIYKTSKFEKMVEQRKELREKEAKERELQDKSVEHLTLLNVRQTVVNNALLGPIIVIEGYVRNDFTTPRDFITVEAKLLDEPGNVLASAEQVCGPTLTLTQLEVLDRDALAKALASQVDIYGKNTGVSPGTQVPFVILFAGIPKDLYSYEVRPISAKISKTTAE